MILSGDIGGTKTLLAIFQPAGDSLKKLSSESYQSREYPTLEEIIDGFLRSHRAVVTDACFGVAGPVKNGRSETTNLAWIIEAKSLAKRLRLRRVGLINDLEANAWGIGALRPKDLEVLSAGDDKAIGNAAVISPGTGLGEAGLYWDGRRHRPFASEGGHCDFAPRSELQIELLRRLKGEFGRVSNERLLSGPGLHNLYRFLRDTGRGEEPPWLAAELAQGDPAALISRYAMEARSPLCEQALDLFVQIYGAVAGDLALKFMATGGIYLGGGIAPKILPKLKEPAFREAFVSKGRLSPVLQAVRVEVILNPETALLGSARWTLHNPPGDPAPKRKRHSPETSLRSRK